MPQDRAESTKEDADKSAGLWGKFDAFIEKAARTNRWVRIAGLTVGGLGLAVVGGGWLLPALGINVFENALHGILPHAANMIGAGLTAGAAAEIAQPKATESSLPQALKAAEELGKQSNEQARLRAAAAIEVADIHARSTVAIAQIDASVKLALARSEMIERELDRAALVEHRREVLALATYVCGTVVTMMLAAAIVWRQPEYAPIGFALAGAACYIGFMRFVRIAPSPPERVEPAPTSEPARSISSGAGADQLDGTISPMTGSPQQAGLA